MAKAFDNRLVSLSVTFPDGETITYDQSYYIVASGIKMSNFNMAQCEARIDNISKDVRNNLITKTAPFLTQRIPIIMSLDVGRESYGTFNLYQGNVFASSPTQPPDIGLTFSALSVLAQAGNPVSFSATPVIDLRTLCGQIATQLGLTLEFTADNKQISNYSFTGPARNQILKIAEAGNVRCFQDGTSLVVMNANAARNSAPILVNMATGMVGVPVLSETGLVVRCLINNQIKPGDSIRVESVINPAANGIWVINQLLFEIASRDTPFYWVMQCRPQGYNAGIAP